MSLARERGMTAGGSVLFLTVLGTLSQLLGFGYRVALSRMVGAEVMGLYQLIMPVYSVLLSLTAVGLTAAVSNLTPQYLALGNRRGMSQLLGTCLQNFISADGPHLAAVVLLCVRPHLGLLLGDARTQLGLVLLLPCVALTGVENLHKHFFYGAGLVRPPAVSSCWSSWSATGGGAGPAVPIFCPSTRSGWWALSWLGMVICEVVSAVHPLRAVPLAAPPPGPDGPRESRAGCAGGGYFPSPCPWGQRPAGQPDGGGERRPGAPEAGGGGAWTPPRPSPSWGWCAA